MRLSSIWLKVFFSGCGFQFLWVFLSRQRWILSPFTCINHERTARYRLRRFSLTLDQTSQLLNELNEKILSLCHVDDIQKEIEDADDFTLRIMTAKDEISMLTTPSKTTIIGTPPPPSTNLATTPYQFHFESLRFRQVESTRSFDYECCIKYSSTSPTLTAKLPKMVLPKFRGKVTNWLSFWDSFNSAVHVNPGLSKIDSTSSIS